MQAGNTKINSVLRSASFCILAATVIVATAASAQVGSGHEAGRGQMPPATNGEARWSQLSGAIVDSSGAVIAGATVQVQSTNGAVERTTRSDKNGDFIISGLAAGTYRFVVSSPDFETKEMQVITGASWVPTRLRISLAVSPVSTTIDVQGRQDDLLGIAESATQGTVGAKEIQDRPILRAGEILETIPGVIITQHAGGGKANQYFLRGFNLDHGTDFAIFLDGMPLNLPSHAHGEGYADMNIVIPEFVKRVNYEKGPYYADVGNYGSAGIGPFGIFQNLAPEFLQGRRRHLHVWARSFRRIAEAWFGKFALWRRGVLLRRAMEASGCL